MVNKCAGKDCNVSTSTARSKSMECEQCKKGYCIKCSKIPVTVFDSIHTANKTRKIYQ